MSRLRFLLLIAAAFSLAAGCATQGPGPEAPEPVHPAVRFAVIADTHVFDVSTSSEGPAYKANLESGLKLLRESGWILDEVVDSLMRERPEFVLVCGDLTKDGERSSHLMAARSLARLADAGIPVYVVPGNHDVMNPHAASYVGSKAVKVDSVTPTEFAEIYGRFGFRDSASRDPASLSYVVQPVPGLRILALDACRYRENKDSPIVDGRFAPATVGWIQEQIRMARSQGDAIMGFMHHGIMEHFKGEESILGAYIVDSAARISALLARGGVRVMFTGHGHAQDIAMRRLGSGASSDFIMDVQTGSLSSHPNPWRLVTIDASQRMRIESRFVTGEGHVESFASFSENRMREGLAAAVTSVVRKMLLSPSSARALSKQIAEVGVSYYRGDEHLGALRFDRSELDWWGRAVAGLAEPQLQNLGNDGGPPDNDLTVDLSDGAW